MGSVSVSTYEKGENHYASLDVTATNVEFIGTKRSDADDTGLSYTPPNSTPSVPAGFVKVDDDDLPF
jgi:hypothetical protein